MFLVNFRTTLHDTKTLHVQLIKTNKKNDITKVNNHFYNLINFEFDILI